MPIYQITNVIGILTYINYFAEIIFIAIIDIDKGFTLDNIN